MKDRYSKVEISAIQKQYWINYQVYQNNTAYNIPSVFHLTGTLVEEALNRSINSVVKRHENFRTIFNPDHTINQFISDELNIPLETYDLKNMPEDLKTEEADLIIYKYVNHIFHLEKGPLIKTALIKTSEKENYLVIVMHHIITDLHTKTVFSEELSKFYNAYAKGSDIFLPEPSFQYRNYVIFHQEWMKSPEYEKMLNSWKENLSEVEDLLEFPTDKKRPKVLSLNGNRLYFDLSPDLTSVLKRIAHQESVNIFALTLTAYSLLLHRYSGQNRFAIGVPLTNRRKDEFKNTGGCFVNILPVVVDFSSDPSFKEVLQQIRKFMLAAHRIQEVPYEAIVRAVGKLRDPSMNPIFQAGFTFEPPMELNLDGINSDSLPCTVEGSKLDQFMTLWEDGPALKGYLEYSTELFGEDTIQRIISNYRQTLRNVPTSLNLAASRFPVVSPEEKKMISDWNATSYPYPDNVCIHRLFEMQVEKNPFHTALVYPDGEMTYQELNKRSNQLAHYLIRIGIGIEDNIGIFIERSPEMMIAIYATLKAGAVYVPVDISYPAERIRYIVEDARVKVLITNNTIQTNFDVPILSLEQKREEISNESPENPQTMVQPHSLAYIIYTSGSTGKPKGAMIEHHSVVNRLYWMQRMNPLTSKDTILQKTPITFDVSVWELFWWAFFGSKLCLLKQGAEKFPEEIIRTVHEFKVSVMHFVPSMLHAFMEYIKNGEYTSKLIGLKTVFSSGEALSPITVNHFNALLYLNNKTRLINLYGPTEATVDVSYFNCDSSASLERIPIGKPIDNTQLFIAGNSRELQPVGAKGELFIAGVGLARGYYNKPELTNEKFLDNSFDSPYKKIYRTGDLARFLPDGNIEFLGRMDFQVKIRGYRIELGEIETLLLNSGHLKEAVVVAVNKGNEDKRLVAYVSAAQGKKDSDVRLALSGLLKETLPSYMIPSAIVFMKKLPLLPNGKLNRKELPEVSSETMEVPAAKTTGQSISLEKEIRNIWQEVLDVTSPIQIDQNFFEIGGNSLLMIQVAVKIQEKLNKKVEILKLFEFPTIELLSKYLLSENIKDDTSRIDQRIQKKKGKMQNRSIDRAR